MTKIQNPVYLIFKEVIIQIRFKPELDKAFFAFCVVKTVVF